LKLNDLTFQRIESQSRRTENELSISRKDGSILGNLTHASGISIESKELNLSKKIGDDLWSMGCVPLKRKHSYWQFSFDEGYLEEIDPSEFTVGVNPRYNASFNMSMEYRYINFFYDMEVLDELVESLTKFNCQFDSLCFIGGPSETNLINVDSQISLIDFKAPELEETYGNKINYVIPKNFDSKIYEEQFNETIEESIILFEKKFFNKDR